jgi:RHO1 GDP-GTP exchange protein 1/2
VPSPLVSPLPASAILTNSYIADGGRKLAYGTDSGIYVSDRKPHSNAKTTPIRVHPLQNVTQIDVLEEYGLLLVLCDKTLFSYPIELLTEHDNATNFQMNRRPKKVSGHVNFFRAGICLGRVFLCVVKLSATNSTIKVLEPIEGLSRGRGKLGFTKLLQGGQDFKVFKVRSPSLPFKNAASVLICGRNSISPQNQHRYIS